MNQINFPTATKWDNKDLNGHVFCAASIFENHIRKAREERAEVARYHDSLPDNAEDAVSAAKDVLQGTWLHSHPHTFQQARAYATSLENLFELAEFRDSTVQDAVEFMTGALTDILVDVSRNLDLLADILHYRGRMKQMQADKRRLEELQAETSTAGHGEG